MHYNTCFAKTLCSTKQPPSHPASHPPAPQRLPRGLPSKAQPCLLQPINIHNSHTTTAVAATGWHTLGAQRSATTFARDECRRPPLLVGVPWTAATADPTPGTPPRPVVAEEPLVQTGSGPPQVAGGGMPGSQVVGGRWSRQRSGPGDTSRTLAVCCTEGSAPIVNPHLTVASFLRSASWL